MYRYLWYKYNQNKNVDNCRKLGIRFFIGHKKKNIKNATIIVKSTAIKENNPELREAKKRKLPIYERVEMLSNIVSLKKNIIHLFKTCRFCFLNQNWVIS